MPWVVAVAKYGEIDRARINTQRQGFIPLQPQYYDRRHKVRRPLFGRYFFVQLRGDRERWGAIHSTRGIQYVITNNGNLVFVKAREIMKLRKMVNVNGLIELPDRPTYKELHTVKHPMKFTKGMHAKIKTGKLAHYIGECTGKTMQRQEEMALGYIRVLVSPDDLEAVDAYQYAAA